MSQTTNTGYERFTDQPDKEQYQAGQYATAQYTPEVSIQQAPVMQVTSFATEIPNPRWNWCNLITSVFSIFCCQVFGIIATVMSLLAYTDHKSKDFQRSRHKISVAWGLSITAIALGCIAIITVIILVIVLSSIST